MNSIRLSQSLGMFMERFAKVLNHLFQFVGITSTQRFRDKGFDSVGQAAVRGGHTYLLSNVKRTSVRSSSEKECNFVPENGHGVSERRVRLLSVDCRCQIAGTGVSVEKVTDISGAVHSDTLTLPSRQVQ